MSPAPQICVVGSCMFDQVTRAPRLPQPGETLFGSSYATGFGGKGSNQAVTAARLGAQVSLVAKLGRDAIGTLTVQHLQEEGIQTEFVFADDELPTGVAPIWVDERSGENSILVVPGANQSLSRADVLAAQDAIRSAQIVLCQMEVPVQCNLEAFRIARQARSVMTLLNPAPSLPLPPELLSLTDVLAPNESEAATLTGMPVSNRAEAARAARALQKQGPPTVVITLGSQGAIALTPSGEIIETSAPIVQAVDTTGAGDCFIGSLAYLVATGLPLPRALAGACQIASRSVLTAGTQTSFPRRAQLDPELFEISPNSSSA